MGGTPTPLTGADFTKGIELAEVPEGGMLLGNAHGEAVILVRQGPHVSAIGATCTHYGAPLADGLIVEGQVRCPWHHACFDANSGIAVGPPALNSLACWTVEHQGTRVVVGASQSPAPRPALSVAPQSVVVIGAGAAGNAAAETLRREGYSGPVTLIGAEPSVPVDRPNLSKDYLAGTAPEEWVALRDHAFYAAQNIELVLGRSVVAVHPHDKRIELSDAATRPYGALLLATGADPIKLTVPGSERSHVHYLRSLSDCRAIIARSKGASCAVVVGASFIGLEVAAALRARGLEVQVVAPDVHPLERVLGSGVGGLIRSIHEEHGVRFHLQHTLASIGEGAVVLDDGSALKADLVVAGIGVRPATAIAEQAGLRVDRGLIVDAFLETSIPGIFAAGDIARWPSPLSAKPIRVEHWVLAERQGQTAARNILGRREPFRAVPFFWSQHYDVSISYVGYVEKWDRIEVAGSLAGRDCFVAYFTEGKIGAIATIQRDKASLEAEALLERGDQAGLEKLLATMRA